MHERDPAPEGHVSKREKGLKYDSLNDILAFHQISFKLESMREAKIALTD